jgi:hypothetical protein
MLRKAWVVSVDMGYGHQRAAYPLKDIAYDHIITANSDKLLSDHEVRIWHRYRTFYEGISRLNSIPLVGKFIFDIYDKLQSIGDMYPLKDMSKPNLQVIYCQYLVRQKKLNNSMMTFMKSTGLPLVSTFFFPAMAAEYAGVKHIYCVVTDADINRVWVGPKPKKSRIIYLAPTESVVKRLIQYGVRREMIILTGFPIPKENIGGKDMRILKKDLGNRLPNLDPKKRYPKFYNKLAKEVLGKNYKSRSNHRLTITYSVGGAGAQNEIGYKILKSLRNRILDGSVKINIAIGTRLDVSEYFREKVIELGLQKHLGKGVTLLFAWNKYIYFRNFNLALRTTDILWTKPSELTFYAGLGIPIIISPPIGSHEYRNQHWLVDMGAGIVQDNPEYAHQWLFDLIESGRLAHAAMQGFIEAPKLGAYNIEKIVLSGRKMPGDFGVQQ